VNGVVVGVEGMAAEFTPQSWSRFLRDASAVPVVVVSPREEDAEAVSQALRRAGAAAHCAWVAEARKLNATAESEDPSLLFVFTDKSMEGVVRAVRYRNKHASTLPVIVVSPEVTERAMAEAMQAGAQDLVSLDSPERFQAVAMRELESARRARALALAEQGVEEYRQRMESMLAASARALVHVQDGIIVSINPACLELLGYAEETDLAGTPVMDLFDPDSQVARKGALVACAKGKWTGPALRAKALGSDGSALPVDATLDRDRVEGEPCVRIELSSIRDTSSDTGVRAQVDADPLAGIAQRRRFLEALDEKLKEELKGGVRALYQIRLDGLTHLSERLGPIVCDDLMIGAGRVVADLLKPGDLFGQLPGGQLGVLVERGNERDLVAWAENVRAKIEQNRVTFQDRVLRCSCSIGAAIAERSDDLNALAARAAKAMGIARSAGGNRFKLDEQKSRRVDDAPMVQRINVALRGEGFKLVFQPIANLLEQTSQMFDVLVRMSDPGSKNEVLPSQFLPVAERNGLMKAIDRWVLGNAIKACREQNGMRAFVRLSSDSIPDLPLVEWLRQQFEKQGVAAERLIVQVTEENYEKMPFETTALVGALRTLGCGFAVEHFGIGTAPLAVIEQVPMNFLKIDGSLMQGLPTDKTLQERVGSYIRAAQTKAITTIAERVEDANTMAVLWQLGVEFIQGYYVQGPEVVLETT
jgi:diguanylate cyclase (GGDEF)-like protein/PAS domain S-box-containing protein